MVKLHLYLSLCFLFFADVLWCQKKSQSLPDFTFANGIGFIAPDSSFSVAIRLRVQNRMGFLFAETNDGKWELTQSEFRVRRMRLRFDGFIFNPKWSYAVQLSFSRADQDWDNSGVPNVLRDAMIFYRPTKHWTFGLGQGKLPGNRQRVISSGEQQFADRSLVNATFNIDRDFGIFANYQFNTGKSIWILRTALSSGEGRNEGIKGFSKVNPGLCYTGRFEFLPFGAFDKRGDYSEADLAREPKPKVSIASGWSYNEGSDRIGGQVGDTLFSPINMHSWITDFVLKYRGFSLYSEFTKRQADTSPITFSKDKHIRYIYQGTGMLLQSGYLFKNNFEIAARFARIAPQSEIQEFEDIRDNYALCFSKYLKGHRLKLQTDVTYETFTDALSKSINGRNIQWRFQIEMGL